MAEISPRHTHSGGAMSMGGMGPSIPSLFYMQDIFWAFVGSAIGLATLVNIINKILCYQRLSSPTSSPIASKSRPFFFRVYATISAIAREYSNYSFPISVRGRQVHLPTVGPATIGIFYLVLIVVCSLYAFHPEDILEWEDIGYRAGFIAICQLPLIILLAGKRNIIGLLTGCGYERLNWLHRWTARSLLFSVLLHMFFWLEEWQKYGYTATKIKQDVITQRGFIAGGILLWLVISSAAPIRGLSYEIFLVQHVISWLAFVAVLYTHVPAENRVWIYAPLALWAFDRIVRTLYMIYNNTSIFRPNQKHKSGLLSCKATFTPLDEHHTRVSIPHPPISWTPGQHIFLSIPTLTPFTSHPFTIASLPTDNTMDFIIQSKKGGTRSLAKRAQKTSSTLPTYNASSLINTNHTPTISVLIDGPYSRMKPLKQFDTVLLIAGSTGATFTVPLLRDLVNTWSASFTQPPSTTTILDKLTLTPQRNRFVTRRVRFVWVLKHQQYTTWFIAQLESAMRTVEDLKRRGMDINLEIDIHITASSSSPLYEEEPKSSLSSIESMVSNGDEKHPRPTSIHPIFLTSQQQEQENHDPSRARTHALNILSSTPRTSSYSSEGDINSIINASTTTSPEPPSNPASICYCALARANGQIPSASCPCQNTTTTSSSQQYPFPSSLSSTKPTLRAGRPNLRNVITQEAEKQRGEMAVVCCGPGSMVQGVRNEVVRLSDERGVEKGSGAWGVWYWGEGFGY